MVSLAPDEPLPQDAAAVRNFLSRALPKLLPVFRGCFDNLTRDPIAGALAKASLTADAGLHKLQMFFEQVGQFARCRVVGLPAGAQQQAEVVGLTGISCCQCAAACLSHHGNSYKPA